MQRPPLIPADSLPVARVAVDVPHPHLDRLFDYMVPAPLHEKAVPGCRVRVRFSGQLVNGFMLARAADSAHVGRLSMLAAVVSAEPVLTPEVAELARAVADRYAGTLSDVLRLAVPPRVAAVEKATRDLADFTDPADRTSTTTAVADVPGISVVSGVLVDREWQRYTHGPQLLQALAAGHAPRAVWTALPDTSWPAVLAEAVAATTRAGRGSIIVVPDRRDVERVSASLESALGTGQHEVLTADLGPTERYRRWLRVCRGQTRVVVGTRSAAFAPVDRLGLVAMWDDGDDLHAEQRAPYCHVREVLSLRAHQQSLGLVIGGFARTAEAASLVVSRFATSVVATRVDVRANAPRVRATDNSFDGTDPLVRAARLPHLAWQTARNGLLRGPVLIQVPRRGYVPSLSCSTCHQKADCAQCHGPLGFSGEAELAKCRWCGTVAENWQCETCGGRRLRAMVVGARRTAEELGRAFADVQVVTSGRDTVLASVPDRRALVVSTPGAEPVATGGYAAALLLDAWALLGRADLRASEETLRRWMAAAALVRPAAAGGEVVVVAEASVRPVQALIRWDPVGHASRELADREAAGLPPACRVAVLTGSGQAVTDLLNRASLPTSAGVLGPTSIAGEQVRTLVRVPKSDGLAMAAALRGAAGERSAHKEVDSVTIRIDPVEIT